MGRLILSSFITVDGVMEAPGFDEHRSGRNAWALRLSDDDVQRFNREQLESAAAILLGRTTYQIWVAFWSELADEEVFGRWVNAMPKYVVSSTLTRAEWHNTTVIRGDLATEIGALKAGIDGDILVQGSADLVDGLIKAGLIDEYRLLVFPVVLGSGKRLFRDESEMTHLRLVSTRAFGSGVVLLTYEPESEAPAGKFAESYTWTPEQVESLHAAQDTDRVLATVMFVDIAGSTERAAQMGDTAWRSVLNAYYAIVRKALARHRGREANTAGDGFLATFDGPARAVRCALEIAQTVKELGIDIRAGVHIGECEMMGDNIGGLAVHIGARIMSEATPGEVLASSTVKDLVAGSGLSFNDRGMRTLKGVPNEWRLFAAN